MVIDQNKVHGSATFTWCDNILWVNVVGPHNEEGIKKIGAEYLYIFSHDIQSTFHIIEEWDNNTLGSPDSVAMVTHFWQKMIPKNCLSIAIVVSNGLQKSICDRMLPSNGKAFYDKEAAQAWLQKHQPKT